MGRLGTLFSKPAPAKVDATPAKTAVVRNHARPQGPLLWVLADSIASAGPAPVLADGLSRLLEEDVHLVVTTDDVADPPASNTIHVPTPGEQQTEIDAFLAHWSPDLCLVIGAPNTPQLLLTASQRGIPLFHASPARRSGGVQRYPSYLQHFHTCLAASSAEADSMRSQFRGKPVAIEIAGPLSDTILAPQCNDAECDQLAGMLGGRPVWLAANAERDEVAMIERAHRKAFRSAHRLLLILVPDDKDKADEIVARLEDDGWRTGRRSHGDEPDAETQVYVADTTGEMGLWYRLAPSTFVGGTFLPGPTAGDPFGPASLGSAVLHGPHTGKMPARFERLGSQGASILVSNAEELGEAVITLLAPDKAASLAQAGWATTTESAHVVERLAELMLAEMDAREGAL